MKKILLVLIGIAMIVAFALIPDRSNATYPIPTPLPPASYPIWFGVYCNWPQDNSTYGYARAKWDGLPSNWIVPADNNVGGFTVQNYDDHGNWLHDDYYNFYVDVYNPGIQIWVANLWIPHQNVVAKLRGNLRLYNTQGFYGNFVISPDPWIIRCPPLRNFLPFIKR